MIDTVIRYSEQQIKGYMGPHNGPLTTIKVNRAMCPLCHIAVAPGDPERRIFLVHGKKVPFRLLALKEYCQRTGWNMPKISENDQPFDIESWLAGKARETFGDAEFAYVTELAGKVRLRTNFFQLAKKSFA